MDLEPDRIPNSNPASGQPNQCESMRIRINNTYSKQAVQIQSTQTILKRAKFGVPPTVD
jgi:hypothetical protein